MIPTNGQSGLTAIVLATIKLVLQSVAHDHVGTLMRGFIQAIPWFHSDAIEHACGPAAAAIDISQADLAAIVAAETPAPFLKQMGRIAPACVIAIDSIPPTPSPATQLPLRRQAVRAPRLSQAPQPNQRPPPEKAHLEKRPIQDTSRLIHFITTS